MDKTIFESVDNYIGDLFHLQDTALKATEKSIKENAIPQISISPNQGKFLHILALLCGASRILEIGTLAGYSTIWLARALPPNGKLITLELDPKHAAVAQENINRAGLKEKVHIRLGKAIETLPLLEKECLGPFDMIFIDADKQPYAEYFQCALRLSRPGTLIVADNVVREGKVLNEKSNDDVINGVRRFNQMLADSTDVTASIIQTVGLKEYDGMALAVVNPAPFTKL
jgi:caffeoyl-CoA O-methyltransferase